MSRRHTSKHHPRHPWRALGTALAAAVIATTGLAGAAAAQKGVQDIDLEHEWQLLTYRSDSGLDRSLDPDSSLDPVPAGIGATLLLFGGADAWGDAACSSYQTSYSVEAQNLFIDPPQIDYVECDPASRDFDSAFYDLLAEVASYNLTGSMLIAKDALGDPLMVLTRATIDDDPTVSRWKLARIGGADGSVEPVINGLDPWMEFLPGGSLVGDTGCGSFISKYATNQGTMDITDVHYRLGSSCTETAHAQAQDTIDALTEVAGFDVLPAGLRLKDAADVTRLAFSPDLDLEKRIWTPTAIFDSAGNVLREGQTLSTSAIKLYTDRADGRTICRPYTAEDIRAGLALNILFKSFQGDPCKAPKKSGKVDKSTVEQDYVQALKATASHALRGTELEFKDVDGNTLMLLEPQADLIGPTWQVQWLGRDRQKVTGLPPTATFTENGLVSGDTGVMRPDAGFVNAFLADFSTPWATRIEITNVDAGRYCANKKRAKTEACQQEKRFLELLAEADGYIAREGDLRLLRATDVIMRLVPPHAANADS